MKTTIVSAGLEDIGEYFKTAPMVTEQAARIAVNSIATRSGMKLIRDKMLDEIAFPAGYLTGDRLSVTKRATNKDLEAVITGRKRATSLARFVTGSLGVNTQKMGLNVRVQRGKTTYLKKAFLVKLKQGASLTEDSFNIGLAIRLQPGESIFGKKTSHKSWLVPGRVALLYGPSVDQVFRTVSGEVAPQLGNLLSAEFFRQFERLSSGR